MIGIVALYQSRLHERTEICLRKILAARNAKRRAQVGRRLRLPLEELQKPDREDVVPLLDDARDVPRRLKPRRVRSPSSRKYARWAMRLIR